jgi:hypothetical protein
MSDRRFVWTKAPLWPSCLVAKTTSEWLGFSCQGIRNEGFDAQLRQPANWKKRWRKCWLAAVGHLLPDTYISYICVLPTYLRENRRKNPFSQCNTRLSLKIGTLAGSEKVAFHAVVRDANPSAYEPLRKSLDWQVDFQKWVEKLPPTNGQERVEIIPKKIDPVIFCRRFMGNDLWAVFALRHWPFWLLKWLRSESRAVSRTKKQHSFFIGSSRVLALLKILVSIVSGEGGFPSNSASGNSPQAPSRNGWPRCGSSSFRP